MKNFDKALLSYIPVKRQKESAFEADSLFVSEESIFIPCTVCKPQCLQQSGS